MGAGGLVAVELDLLDIGVADIGGIEMAVAVLAGIFLIEKEFGAILADMLLEFLKGSGPG